MNWETLSSRALRLWMALTAVFLVGGVAASLMTLNFDWLIAALMVAAILAAVFLSRAIQNLSRIVAMQIDQGLRQSMLLTYGPGEPLDSLRRDLQRDISGMLALNALVPPQGAVPPPGGWAATPETLLTLVSRVLSGPENPLIVECGSGTSTVWIAMALRERGGGKVISLEHDTDYADQTRRVLSDLGLSAYAEVRHAPLVTVQISGHDYQWFDTAALSGLNDITLLFVDGPPGYLGQMVRFPAIPLLAPQLGTGAWVVLDDIDRADEKKIVDGWLDGEWAGVGFIERSRTDRAVVLEVRRV